MSKTIDLPGAPLLPPPPSFPTLQGPRGWRKFFAVAGIVGGFLILLTIPGWVALGTYRRWKAGERGQPNLLIVWGVCFVLLCSAVVIVQVAARIAPAGTAKALSGIVPEPEHVIPAGLPGFTSAPGEDGWTTYEVSAPAAFTIGLPEGWLPGTDGTDVPEETVFVASLFDTNGGALMLVTRYLLADATEDSLVTAERVAEYAEGERDTLGRAEVSQASLPVGPSYVVAWDARALEGEVTDTRFIVYGTNHEGYGYQFVFALPAGDSSFESDADHIARSLAWMD